GDLDGGDGVGLQAGDHDDGNCDVRANGDIVDGDACVGASRAAGCTRCRRQFTVFTLGARNPPGTESPVKALRTLQWRRRTGSDAVISGGLLPPSTPRKLAR